MTSKSPEPLPPYSYVPGGPWPHPTRSPQGHLHGLQRPSVGPIRDDCWEESGDYLQGLRLFNTGYYWEAHEAWEPLWHAHGRSGPTAWILQALIKLAAAGVKIRERRPDGARTHATRAGRLIERAIEEGGRRRLGLDLVKLRAWARSLAADPPSDASAADVPVARVFAFELRPSRYSDSTTSVPPDIGTIDES